MASTTSKRIDHASGKRSGRSLRITGLVEGRARLRPFGKDQIRKLHRWRLPTQLEVDARVAGRFGGREECVVGGPFARKHDLLVESQVGPWLRRGSHHHKDGTWPFCPGPEAHAV